MPGCNLLIPAGPEEIIEHEERFRQGIHFFQDFFLILS